MKSLCFASSIPIGRPGSKLSCTTPIRSHAPKINMVAEGRFPGEYDPVIATPKAPPANMSESIANDLLTLSGPLESQCGQTWDSQQVEHYDGTLGVTREFVDDHESPVGLIRWRSDIEDRYRNPGNVSGVRWCTGTLISDDIFLSAGHCFNFRPGGWVFPTRDDGSAIPNAELARELVVEFGYQRDAQGNIRTPVAYPIEALVENTHSGAIDFGMVRLGRTNNKLPGQVYGSTPVSNVDAVIGDMCCIIGHPVGRPKSIEAGPIDAENSVRLGYGDIDTLGGNSGSGILREHSRDIVGVHTNGGCGPNGGFNVGMKISAIIDRSPTVREIANRPRWTSIMEVPGGFAPENQGAGITFANISEDAANDLVVMHIENAQGDNTAYYRVGKNVHDLPNGNMKIDNWTGPIPVPGWIGQRTDASDVAFGNIRSGTSKDLIIFHIDNPHGENYGYYKVGFSLDSNGKATGGWTNHIQIPGWFGSSNQGGGLTVAPIRNASSKDLVVMHIDNPSGPNKGYYRVGYDLGSDGRARGGWSEVIEVPGWFGWENQGGSVEVFDTNGNGKLDIVIFHVDNPNTDNHGYYRIGRDLNDKGEVTGGWSNLVEVPGWFGWETQGAGIAMKKLNGANPMMGIFHIDNPRGDNQGYLRFGSGSFA